MAHRDFKDRLYHEFARVAQALASERRLELIDLLAQAPRHVEALAAETDMSVASVSQHLQILRHARLVEGEREGTKIHYRLADDSVLRLWLDLRSVAESRLAEVGQAVREFAAVDAHEGVPPGVIASLVTTGEAVLIDVRPPLEYGHGHLPGARSIPIEELPRRLSELPKDRRIIAYCRGRYCLFADEAVALLRRHGFDAVRMEGGFPEWLAERRKIAGGASAPRAASGRRPSRGR